MKEMLLPVTQKLTPVYALSLACALLMTGVSLTGLLAQDSVYPTEELRQGFLSNDLVNLLIGLPILLGSMWFTRSSRLIGLLFWPGALFFITYNSIAYSAAVPMNILFVFHPLLVFLSAYTIFRLVKSMDAAAIQQRLKGTVKERLGGAVLMGFGVLFFFWRLSTLVQTINGHTLLPRPELAVVIADLLVTPLWAAGGLLLWRRRALGYAAGAGLLFQASMLFIGLLVYFILQPFMAGVPFPLEDFVAIFVMGLVCFIPFGLFVRGVLKKQVAQGQGISTNKQ